MGGKSEIKKIAVIRLDRVGDLILTTPAIALIREKFPKTSICAFVSHYTKDVLEGNPSVDEIITVGPASNDKDFSAIDLFRAGRSMRNRKFDIAFVFSPHTSSYVFAYGLGAPRRIGYTYASRKFTRLFASFLLTDWVNEPPDQIVAERENLLVPHEIEQNAALVAYAAKSSNDTLPDPVLIVSEKDKIFAEDFLKGHGFGCGTPVLGLHLAVRWRKSLSNDMFGELLERLAIFWNGPVLITSGPGEQEWLKELHPVFEKIQTKFCDYRYKSKIIQAGSLSLKQWAALIKSCHVLVSPDTGSLHVASAMKVPVVAIMEERFYKYHSSRWAPWNVPYVIVKKPENLLFEEFVCGIEKGLQQLSLDLRGNKICQMTEKCV